jgi:(2Fe-2S) ferredoxin
MLKSVEDLDKLRAEASNALRLRNGHASARVVIAMGTCGIAAGAREVLLAVMDELAARSIEGVEITQTGCRGLCEREPMMEVQKPGLPVVTYGDLDPERARAIVAQHLGEGVVIEEWVITQAGRPEATA